MVDIVVPKSILEYKISTLEPFNEPQPKDEKSNPNGLMSELLGVLRFADHIQDKTVKEGLMWYLNRTNILKSPRSSAEPKKLTTIEPPQGMLEDFAKYTLEELASVHKYKPAYRMATFMNYTSQAVGLFTVSGVGRNLMAKLKESDAAKFGRMDPIDQLQFFDLLLKGALGAAYQIILAAPDHTEAELAQIKGLHGWEYARHLLNEMPEYTKNAVMRPMRVRHNAYFWGGYAILDFWMNLPGHLLVSGAPVKEAEAVVGKMTNHLGEYGHDAIREASEAKHDVANYIMGKLHIPGAGKVREVMTQNITELLPDNVDYHAITRAGHQHSSEGLASVDKPSKEVTLRRVGDGGTRMSTHYTNKREFYDNAVERAERSEGSKLLTIAGGLVEGVVAAIDVAGVYKGLARGDIFEDAARRAIDKVDLGKYKPIEFPPGTPEVAAEYVAHG
jgi:hypothetical protein